MQETAREYLRRIEGYLGRDDPFDVLRSTPSALSRIVKGAPSRRLSERPEPEKWSPVEILAHLADVEIVWSYRIRKILEEPGGPIAPMEQDRWVAECRYAKARPAEALEAFAALRRWNLALFSRIGPRGLRRAGEHGWFGRLTIGKIARMLAGHDRNHLRRLRELLRRR
ncbi:MAG TPA: DinB family protein [Thermoanaerobaculia bacterium]|nr:DinB family protein [Thermoanaerobaculia bacterium]